MADRPVRRNSAGEETRRRVLDAVVATVHDVGYYSASSNEIARRAGVSWGAIHHLFGSREQLMYEVFEDIGQRAQAHYESVRIEGSTLEERLESVLTVLRYSFDRQRFLVEAQILLDLSSNPRVASTTRGAMRRLSARTFSTRVVRPLLTQALGDEASDDLCMYAYTALHGHLASREMLGLSVKFRDDDGTQDLMILGVATAIRATAEARNISIPP